MSAEDASTKMLVISRSCRSSRLVADKLLALRHGVATFRLRSAMAQLEAEPWRCTVDASLLIDDIDCPRVRRVDTVSTTMMTAEPMMARGAHYTALLDTIDHQGATKLHAGEREQLVEAADALLFGEPDSGRTVRSAEVLIEALESSERWSVDSCDQVRELLHGCGAPTGAS